MKCSSIAESLWIERMVKQHITRIFAKRYNIRKGNVSSIKLSAKSNVHIFAVTLEL